MRRPGPGYAYRCVMCPMFRHDVPGVWLCVGARGIGSASQVLTGVPRLCAGL